MLATVLTLESIGVFSHFAAAVLGHACWVEYPVVVLYAGNVPVEEEEVVLVGVILVVKALTDLTDQVQIAIPLSFLSVLPILVPAIVLALVLVVGGAALAAFTLVGFEC